MTGSGFIGKAMTTTKKSEFPCFAETAKLPA
jgi:hypothetical protein